jgi:membrane-associated phospholipid phosphatase
MNRFIQKNKTVLILYALLLIVSSVLLLFVSKASLHLFINQYHNPFFDLFFKYLTWMGSGWMVAVLFFILLARYKREAVIFLAGNLLITIFVQGLKHLVFNNMLRPAAYFKDIHPLYLIPGEAMHLYNSFPSGHSATAFGLFVILIYLTKNQWGKLAWLFLALLIAFSRVYLSQHFLMDILAGSFIGTIGMGFTIYFFDRYFPEFFSQKTTNETSTTK